MPIRKIIEIDEEKCDGCGQCVTACAESALEIKDGKARLKGEILCDGLGACLGGCPTGALRIVEREAPDFDERAVEKRLHQAKPGPARGHKPEAVLACGCPSSATMSLTPRQAPTGGPAVSSLGHWPIKLQLLNPQAPFLKGADLVLLADCAAAAYPALHQRLLPGRAVALGCPKLDDLEAHIQRLAEILRVARPKSLTAVHMEVPCCRGFVHAAQEAVRRSGHDLPLNRVEIARTGEIREQEGVDLEAEAA